MGKEKLVALALVVIAVFFSINYYVNYVHVRLNHRVPPEFLNEYNRKTKLFTIIRKLDQLIYKSYDIHNFVDIKKVPANTNPEHKYPYYVFTDESIKNLTAFQNDMKAEFQGIKQQINALNPNADGVNILNAMVENIDNYSIDYANFKLKASEIEDFKTHKETYLFNINNGFRIRLEYLGLQLHYCNTATINSIHRNGVNDQNLQRCLSDENLKTMQIKESFRN